MGKVIGWIADGEFPMRHSVSVVVALGLACALHQNASAQTLIERYTAEIGDADRANSSGAALTKVEQILQQDRANVHRYGKRQAGDSIDRIFSSRKNRARFGALLAKGQITPEAGAAILSGTSPTVVVEIFGKNNRADYLTVRLDGSVASTSPPGTAVTPSSDPTSPPPPAIASVPSVSVPEKTRAGSRATASEAAPTRDRDSARAHASTPPAPTTQAAAAAGGWHIYGADGRPAMTWTDGAQVGPAFTCGDTNMPVLITVPIRLTLPEVLARHLGEPNVPVQLRLRNSDAVSAGYRRRLDVRFFAPDDLVHVALPPAVPNWLDALPEDSALGVLKGDTTSLMEIPMAGFKAPFTALMRICGAGVRPADAPAFSCIGNLLSEAGHQDICRDPDVSALDAESLRRFLDTSEAAGLSDRIALWRDYQAYTEARTACFRDMACVAETAQTYIESLPVVPTPAEDGPTASTVIAELASDSESARLEAASHGIDGPTLVYTSDRTLYFTSDCQNSCATYVFAIHDIGPDDEVPIDREVDLEALKIVGMRYGPILSLFHMRLGHALPPRPVSGLPVGYITRENAMAVTGANGGLLHFRFDQTFEPRTWAEVNAEITAGIAYSKARAERQEAALRLRQGDIRRAEAERAERLGLAGQVYKSPGFWSSFFNPDALRTVFEGGRLSRDSMALRQMVGGFVMAYDAKCAAHLPDDSPILSETTIQQFKNLYGITLREYSTTQTFRVHPDLAPFLSEMLESPPTPAEAQAALDVARTAASGNFNVANASRLVAGHAIDVQRLVAAGPCDGAVTRQFLANLSALANGRPTVAETGVAISGAAEASDPPPAPGRFASLADACLDASGYNPDSHPRCNCVERTMVPEMSPDQIAAAQVDFRAQSEAWFHGGRQADTLLGKHYQRCVAQTAE